jgi:protein SCO1/2
MSAMSAFSAWLTRESRQQRSVREPYPRSPLAGRTGAACKALLTAAVFAAGAYALPAAPEPTTVYRLTPWPAGAQSPQFTLQEANGKRRTLTDYHGRVVVIFFGFLRCPDACPTELYKLARVVHALGAVNKPPQILFITLDPQRDTPTQLSSYVHSFDPGFIALTGTPAQIQRATDSFGVQFARVVQGRDYTIDHSTATYIFDARGRLRLVGALNSSEADVLHDLKALLAEQTP